MGATLAEGDSLPVKTSAERGLQAKSLGHPYPRADNVWWAKEGSWAYPGDLTTLHPIKSSQNSRNLYMLDLPGCRAKAWTDGISTSIGSAFNSHLCDSLPKQLFLVCIEFIIDGQLSDKSFFALHRTPDSFCGLNQRSLETIWQTPPPFCPLR